MNAFLEWAKSSGLKIGLILVAAWTIERFIAAIITRLVRGAMNPDNYASQREEQLRENTISELVIAIARVAIVMVAFMIVLSELGIDIGPLLAGAGVLGLALGFGTQSLIKDLVAGIYIVLENQYRVGDIVRLNNLAGKVQKITTRITVLRDQSGNVHYIPNGSIQTATNMTMEYANVNLDVRVAYEDDVDKVRDVINKVGLKISGDPEWSDTIIEAPYFVRVSDFSDSAVVIKILGKVLPAKQWAVEGELRRRLLMAFAKGQVTIPHPTRPATAAPAKTRQSAKKRPMS